MTERLFTYVSRHRLEVEAALEDHLPRSSQSHARRLNGALRYSLFPGGKRWRPMLTLLGAELSGAQACNALPAACAMEFLHTSSVIFDDLPAMDDAPLRRGRAALHCVFGESVALLAALALMNESYALLARTARQHGDCAAARLVEDAARCIGADGMIGGQAVDLALSGSVEGPEALASRNLKTTALMRLTMMVGAAACGAGEDDTAALGDYGESLGMAYQICDDLLDELAETEFLGKPAKQDLRHARPSYAAELGPERAQRLAGSLIQEADASLRRRFGNRLEVDLLSDAAALILQGTGCITPTLV
ncbi:MAG TPA: polyprenyl synthetase family protein [Blastocatellia bacterium]|nr:polyprenyl synthetase family protein [Blastocatellia bacterium]HMV86959.1 polyprenyl synthetase family protein [Blastocatellia bacterium]HMX28046.1 polyprenyl synthetase family protein [Blastocatellia bacterium]HMY72220.1 polyprenyl synthetase family protein [Blastocatellia bacterium]HMZ17039.1 polyprenyl synthetase family protein [Blastocatellia bacterium]